MTHSFFYQELDSEHFGVKINSDDSEHFGVKINSTFNLSNSYKGNVMLE